MVPLAVKLEADLKLPCPEERIPNQKNVLIKYTGTDFKLFYHQTRVLNSILFLPDDFKHDHGIQKFPTIPAWILDNT